MGFGALTKLTDERGSSFLLGDAQDRVLEHMATTQSQHALVGKAMERVLEEERHMAIPNSLHEEIQPGILKSSLRGSARAGVNTHMHDPHAARVRQTLLDQHHEPPAAEIRRISEEEAQIREQNKAAAAVTATDVSAAESSELGEYEHDIEVVPTTPASTSKSLQEHKYFTATGDSAVSTPGGLDSPRMALGAWVNLDNLDEGMKTIVSNKASGCEAHDSQYGFALFINGWGTADHHLYLEYGNARSGCHKISAPGYTFAANTWVHVGALLEHDSTSLFINGALVAEVSHSKSNAGTGEKPPHEINPGPFTVGMYDLTQYPFNGKIAHLAFVSLPSELTDDLNVHSLMASLMKEPLVSQHAMEQIPGLVAYFPLDDDHQHKTGAHANSYSNGKEAQIGKGLYRFGSSLVGGVGKEVFGLKVPLNDGLQARPLPSQGEIALSIKNGAIRAEKIKYATKELWASYKKYAWGYDELKPLGMHGTDNWGGMGVTLVDSLDTLWILGLKDEFNDARDWVTRHMTYKKASTVSVFETTIRVLGGLLAAYDFSGDAIFLSKARELGDMLSPAFSTSSGIATGQVDLHTGHTNNGWSGGSAILSEFGSLQLEFRNLAKYAKSQKYEDMSMRGLRFMYSRYPRNGLLGVKIDIASGKPTDNTITLGALGDSFYEYLLKVWIQGGKKESWLREMYDQSMNGVMDLLLASSSPGNLVFVADWNGRSQHRKMDHLVCFLPGILALGAHTDPLGADSERAKRDIAVAKSLMYTCHEMYHSTKSGIAAEFYEFPKGKGIQVSPQAPFYILRPETAESLFVLGQLTGDPIYREWSWQIWQAIEEHCKLPHGYGALRNVNAPEKGCDDRMESFFLGETIKYLYLTQNPEKIIDLDEYVFNTEAHPTRIFKDHRPVQP